MSVSFTTVGTTLDAIVLDENFETIQDLFREGLVTADFISRFDVFRIYRYTNGHIESMKLFANPFRTASVGITDGSIDRFMINYISNGEDSGDPVVAAAREHGGALGAYPMELLGRPGKSFYYAFEEDGLQDPEAIAGPLTGWPPAGWPYTRFSEDVCYSRWLTVPGAALRCYVPEKATCRIKAHAKGSLTAWMMAKYYDGADANTANPQRDVCHARLGIVVDTNPQLWDDEFPNANRWIRSPDGTQASVCSWKLAADRTFCMAQREKFELWASNVSLQGRRWYNFSLRCREPGHYGWINRDDSEWVDKVWEWCWDSHRGKSNAPVLTLGFETFGLSNRSNFFDALWIALWESSGIEVEFKYGMNGTHVTNDHDDFDTIYRPAAGE